MQVQPKYGLQITNNSKTGPAFSLSRQNTCINRTSTCTSVCYGRGIRYQSEAQKAKRLQNFETVELLLQLGGSELLAENLCVLIDQVRPIDWLTSRITNCPTALPWTLRIHDVGDFYSVAYVNAWTLAVQSRPECSFWFYTRSFIRDEMCEALSILCALPNCQGWLSVDEDNYNRGLIVFSRFRQLGWKLALLQNDLNSIPRDLIPKIESAISDSAADAINFPRHHAGRHVKPAQTEHLRTCPQILGQLPLQSSPSKARPCQSCAFCLPPGMTAAAVESWQGYEM